MNFRLEPTLVLIICDSHIFPFFFFSLSLIGKLLYNIVLVTPLFLIDHTHPLKSADVISVQLDEYSQT